MTVASPKKKRSLQSAKLLATYAGLVALLPPRPLHDATDAASVAEVLGMLGGHKLNADQQDYATLLARLYADWQAQHSPRPRRLAPHELLGAIMEESGMTQAAMAKLLGVGQPLVSAMLTGRRELSKPSIRRLCSHFRLDSAAFL